MTEVNRKKEALEILQNQFGYSVFRENQWESINDILHQKDTLILMPTGGGKSLCYQIPALMMNGTAVVISPLISLMKDQVDSLAANGIYAAFYNSSLNEEEQRKIESELMQQQIKLLYVSPETFVTDIFISMLQNVNLSLIAVDEAHCISSWGHDFRPEYAKIGRFRNKLKNIPFVALTATADKLTKKDIVEQLQLSNHTEYVSSFNRANLSLNILPGKNRWDNILALLLERKNTSGIIYCTSRKTCESLADKLCAFGFDAAPYHAGLHKDVREKTQNDFIKDELQIVVATIAFGMGIDKSNVRWVIHYNLPKNIESYYQEIGRAGRDGAPADTFLFSTYADFLQIKDLIAQSGQREFMETKLQRLMDYTEARSCRRKILLAYFGEILPENCENCDVCEHPPKVFDATVLAQKALSAVIRLKQNEGVNMIIEVLRGSSRTAVYEKQYHVLPTFGVGKDLSFNEWQQYILQLINLGYFEIAYDNHNNLKVTDLGKKVLFDNQKVELVKSLERQAIQKRVEPIKEQNTFKFGKTDPVLFEKMRKLRLEIAKRENKAPYMIFSDNTLQQLAAVKPKQLKEFTTIEGIGNHKKDLYGASFLQLILENN